MSLLRHKERIYQFHVMATRIPRLFSRTLTTKVLTNIAITTELTTHCSTSHLQHLRQPAGANHHHVLSTARLVMSVTPDQSSTLLPLFGPVLI